jgi:hypothetical protein
MVEVLKHCRLTHLYDFESLLVAMGQGPFKYVQVLRWIHSNKPKMILASATPIISPDEEVGRLIRLLI